MTTIRDGGPARVCEAELVPGDGEESDFVAASGVGDDDECDFVEPLPHPASDTSRRAAVTIQGTPRKRHVRCKIPRGMPERCYTMVQRGNKALTVRIRSGSQPSNG